MACSADVFESLNALTVSINQDVSGFSTFPAQLTETVRSMIYMANKANNLGLVVQPCCMALHTAMQYKNYHYMKAIMDALPEDCCLKMLKTPVGSE